MKIKQLLTKTLLVAVGLLVGASVSWGSVETYPFNTWSTGTVYMTAGEKQSFTVSVPVSSTPTALDMYLIPNVTLGGVSRNFNGRFAVSDFKASGGATKGWWFAEGMLRTNASNSGTDARQYGPFAMSILNLYEGDEVTITTCNSNKATKTLTFRSSNAKNKSTNEDIVAGTTTHSANGTATYIMTSDGHLDFSGSDAVMIASISISSSHGAETIDSDPVASVSGANYGDRTIKIESPLTSLSNATKTYYTKDGSTPSTNSTLYSGTFTVTSSDKVDGKVTIKAITYKEGDTKIASGVSTLEVNDVGTTLTLNAPGVEMTDFTKSGDTYYPQYKFSSDQQSVAGNPSVTYSYTIAGEGNATPNPSIYSEAKAGELIVTVSAEGYNSASAEAITILPYTLSKSYDFSKSYTLNSNWEATTNTGMRGGTYDVNTTRYEVKDIDVNVKDALFDGLTFSQNYHDIYYFVQELGLGYFGGSGHNTTTITIDGLGSNDYTLYKKYMSGTPNTTENVIVAGNNTWTLGKTSGTGAHILRGIFVYSPDPVALAIADCKKHEASAAFANAVDAGSFSTADEVYAFHTAWQIAQAEAASSNDITKVIFDAPVSDFSRWNNARSNSNQQYTGAPDNKYFDAWDSQVSDAKQKIYGLPAGNYSLKVATRASEDLSDKSKYNVWVSGGSANVSTLGNHDGNTGGELGNGWSWTIIPFTLDAKADVEIGFYSLPGEGSNLWAGADDWHLYKLPENVSKTISDAGWATYCSPYALDLSNATGLTGAYIVTGGENGVLTKTPVMNGTVPANTGLLLKGPAGTATIPVVPSGDASNVTGNKLVGVTAETPILANAGYVLLKEDNVLGFYKNTNAFTLGANTAYLPVSFDQNGAARASYLLFDDMTGISQVAGSKVKTNGAIYNLNGQRVSNPTKGIYIIDGVKVAIE